MFRKGMGPLNLEDLKLELEVDYKGMGSLNLEDLKLERENYKGNRFK